MSEGPFSSISWDDLLRWGGIAVMLAATGLVLWALLWDRSRGRLRCRRCWYELAGVAASEGVTTCPECGREHAKQKHTQRTRRRPIAALAGLAMVAAGYSTWAVPRVKHEGWVGFMPTPALLVASPWIRANGMSPFAHYYQTRRPISSWTWAPVSGSETARVLASRERNGPLADAITQWWVLPRIRDQELAELPTTAAGFVVLDHMSKGKIDWKPIEPAIGRALAADVRCEKPKSDFYPGSWFVHPPVDVFYGGVLGSLSVDRVWFERIDTNNSARRLQSAHTGSFCSYGDFGCAMYEEPPPYDIKLSVRLPQGVDGEGYLVYDHEVSCVVRIDAVGSPPRIVDRSAGR